jgi:hypothetical protein
MMRIQPVRLRNTDWSGQDLDSLVGSNWKSSRSEAGNILPSGMAWYLRWQSTICSFILPFSAVETWDLYQSIRIGLDFRCLNISAVTQSAPKSVPLRIEEGEKCSGVGSCSVPEMSFRACWPYIEWGVGSWFVNSLYAESMRKSF